jgi:preprotein translocase subunit SecG
VIFADRKLILSLNLMGENFQQTVTNNILTQTTKFLRLFIIIFFTLGFILFNIDLRIVQRSIVD